MHLDPPHSPLSPLSILLSFHLSFHLPLHLSTLLATDPIHYAPNKDLFLDLPAICTAVQWTIPSPHLISIQLINAKPCAQPQSVFPSHHQGLMERPGSELALPEDFICFMDASKNC